MLKTKIEYILIIVLRRIINLLNIFPIKKNRIICYSFNGKQYSCNPRRITEYLLQNYPDKFEIIWAFKDPSKLKNIVPNKIKITKFRSLKYYYLAKTSKVIIYNVQGFGELSRRKKQIVIQTWHASNGYKKVGVYAYKGIQRKIIELEHKDYSYVMSGSNNMTLRRVRGSMNFKGPVLPGTPRMDLLINQNSPELYKKVYNFFNISPEMKIVLYAPTWRKGSRREYYDLDYALLKKVLEERFGGKWVIGIRLHPNIHTHVQSNLPYVINMTQYPDMEELLYVANVLISDYSSCIWDYSFLNRPCFLYCVDFNTASINNMFDIPIEKWRFSISHNMDELLNVIYNYDAVKFAKNMELHHEEMGSLEDGKATDRVCKLISEVCLR